MNVVSYHQRNAGGDFPRGPVAGTTRSQAGGPGLIPCQGIDPTCFIPVQPNT